jgi:predicted GNAT family N-acyltransferase
MMSAEVLIVSKEYGVGELSREALKIRQTVFVAEQGVPLDLELDNYDAATTHYVGFTESQPVTTARVLVTDNGNNWHIQRVATLSDARGHGYAGKIMETIIEDAREAGVRTLDLGAQLTALNFYEKLGFVTEGQVFLDAGIEHQNMRLKLTD